MLKELETLATPELYERNPYRVLKVEVGASPRTIGRRREDLDAAFEMGEEALEFDHLADGFAPDELAIRGLFEVLNDPRQAFAWAFFSEWSEGVGSGWEKIHDQFVDNHLKFLSDVREERRTDWRGIWVVARRVVLSEEFWRWLRKSRWRCDDPRLSDDFLHRFQQELPTLLTEIQLQVVERFAVAGRIADAEEGMAATREMMEECEVAGIGMQVLIERRMGGLEEVIKRGESYFEGGMTRSGREWLEVGDILKRDLSRLLPGARMVLAGQKDFISHCEWKVAELFGGSALKAYEAFQAEEREGKQRCSSADADRAVQLVQYVLPFAGAKGLLVNLGQIAHQWRLEFIRARNHEEAEEAAARAEEARQRHEDELKRAAAAQEARKKARRQEELARQRREQETALQKQVAADCAEIHTRRKRLHGVILKQPHKGLAAAAKFWEDVQSPVERLRQLPNEVPEELKMAQGIAFGDVVDAMCQWVGDGFAAMSKLVVPKLVQLRVCRRAMSALGAAAECATTDDQRKRLAGMRKVLQKHIAGLGAVVESAESGKREETKTTKQKIREEPLWEKIERLAEESLDEWNAHSPVTLATVERFFNLVEPCLDALRGLQEGGWKYRCCETVAKVMTLGMESYLDSVKNSATKDCAELRRAMSLLRRSRAAIGVIQYSSWVGDVCDQLAGIVLPRGAGQRPSGTRMQGGTTANQSASAGAASSMEPTEATTTGEGVSGDHSNCGEEKTRDGSDLYLILVVAFFVIVVVMVALAIANCR